jgi:hypothetical protein
MSATPRTLRTIRGSTRNFGGAALDSDGDERAMQFIDRIWLRQAETAR